MRSRGLFLVFSVAVLFPGMALAVLGIRALMHERRLAAYDAHERLARAADAVLRDVDSEFREWRWALERASSAPLVPSTLPTSLRPAFTRDGSMLVLTATGRDAHWWPQGGLLYSVAQDDDGAGTPPGATSQVAAATRPRLVHRRGRALRDAGDLPGAVAVFDGLRQVPGSVGSVPAGLVGRYEMCDTWALANDRGALADCAAAFYRELVTGEWLLPSERYLYYAVKARTWLQQSGADVGQVSALERIETAKRTLADAARTLQLTPCDATTSPREPRITLLPQAFALRRCASPGGSDRETAFIVRAEWLDAHLWPLVAREATRSGYHVAVIAQDGREIFATAAARPPARGVLTRDGTGTAFGLRLQVWPQDAERLAAASVARQRWYTGVLALVAVSLLLGAYAMTRIVRRELQVAQMKSDFVATVSHELRTPVTAIRQLGELLLRGRVPERRRREYYERITEESERLGHLIDNVLDFAQMEAGRKQYDFRPLDTSAWLRQTLDAFRSRHEITGLTLTAVIPDALPVLEADATALGSAVHNLLDNAVKYSPGHPEVWVEAETDGRGVTIRVRDQGVGIGDDERQRVFERFYRTERDVSRAVRGAGLGLSLVHHIVTAHHGHIGLESRLGSGSTFSIHLPAAPSRS